MKEGPLVLNRNKEFSAPQKLESFGDRNRHPSAFQALDDLPAKDVGLLFMCFQQNVEDQFEFIQRTWADNEHFPTGIPTLGVFQKDTGDDPLIGQNKDESQRWPKSWGDKDAGKKTFNFESAITLEGGEYFFAPSMAFLKGLATP